MIIKLSFQIAFTKHKHRYRRRNPKQMEGQKERNPKVETITSDSAAGSEISVQPLEITIKQPPNHLEMLEDSNTNTLQLESLKSDSG